MDLCSNRALRTGLLALVAFAAGCNSTGTKGSSTGADSGGSADVTDGGAKADGSADTGPFDAAAVSDGAGPSDGAAAGAICSSEKACSGALFCDLPLPSGAGGCGQRYVNGTCVARPATCPAGGAPVCGCDGVTYQNDCLRQKAGIPIASMGACQGWEKGPINCGAMTCGPSQVCVRPGSTCGAPPPCMPAPDGGTCPAGLVACSNPADFRPGCTYSCSPPSPYCLDVPPSCQALPTCACLQPTSCHCEGIRMGREVVCGGAA